VILDRDRRLDLLRGLLQIDTSARADRQQIDDRSDDDIVI